MTARFGLQKFTLNFRMPSESRQIVALKIFREDILHGGFVQIEAVTPYEYQQRGRGVTIWFGYHETPYGLAFVAQTPH